MCSFWLLNKGPLTLSKDLNTRFAHFMKNTKWLALVAAVHLPILCAEAQAPALQVPSGSGPDQATAAVTADISPATAEVVTLAEAGSRAGCMRGHGQNA